jgi:RNA polymerase sigma-70 factor, ECF subfamily
MNGTALAAAHQVSAEWIGSRTLSDVKADANIPTDSDESLMLRYCEGDAAAFDDLYARHRGPLFRFITRQLQQAQRDQADEVFQEVWMNVIQARESYRVGAQFRTYLYTLAHHRVMDFFRRYHRAGGRAGMYLFSDSADGKIGGESDADSSVAGNLTASRVDEPEVIAISREQGAAILRLLADLPAPQREAFLLSEEAGLSIEQIAETTGSTFEAAKSRLRYAMSKLREGLKEHL